MVLGFPSNDFGGQEPGTEAEIKTFCKRTYDVSFPMFSKVTVKGEGKVPLYRYLTESKGGEVRWNFTKFLVDRNGKVVARFEPGVKPESDEVTKAVEGALTKK